MSKRLPWPLLSMFALAIICLGDSNQTRITISGQVVDDQSQGVAGIKVQGRTYVAMNEAITDKDGRFVLHVLEDRVKQLTVVVNDTVGDRIGKFRADWDDPPTADKSIEIKLAACRRLPVEVTDATARQVSARARTDDIDPLGGRRAATCQGHRDFVVVADETRRAG